MRQMKHIIDGLTRPAGGNWIFAAAFGAVPILYLIPAASRFYVNDHAVFAIIPWCANSLFLAILLRTRREAWPPAIATAAAANFAAHLLIGKSILATSGIVIADVFEICATAALFRQINRGANWYLSVKTILLLTVFSSLACLLSAAFEFAWISLLVPATERPIIQARSFTEALDLLVALPLVLSWTERSLLERLNPRKLSQIAVLTIASAAASYALLVSHTPFLFLAIPLLLLATLSGGLLGSSAAVFGVSLAVRLFTFNGPAALSAAKGAASAELLIIYNLFVLTALLSAIPLGVLLARLENAAHRLREAGAAADRAREEAEAARDKAETAGRAKSDFLSVMSHELRTPMTGVLGLVDLLAKESLTDNQKINLDLVRQSGHHLLSVINNILDFSKIESGKFEIESTIFSVRSLFDEVCATTQPLCHAKDIAFKEDYSERIPACVIGDPTKIRQVLLNFVGNAIKFTHHGTIRIIATHRSINENKLLLRIEVQDSGIGIAEENQAEVFTAFTQEDKSTARRYGGSGLGLAISRRLVTAMGGTIGFTSSPGSGSRFWFEIPLLEHDGSDVVAPIPCRPSDLQPRRILVAEDIPLIRSIIRSMLASDRHTLIFAQDGAEVVELAKQGCFDLILMDVQMPVMDGVEATRAIRRLEGPERSLPIIALTANVYESERRRYLEAGMNSCIAKPIDWGSLNASIAHYTARTRNLVSGSAVSPTPPPQQSDLLDDRKLQSLQKRLGSELESLLLQALRNAHGTCAYLDRTDASGKAKAKEVHALKGMAGMLGLSGMQRLCLGLEIELGCDQSIGTSNADLRAMITSTRAALVRKNFLTEPEFAAQTGL